MYQEPTPLKVLPAGCAKRSAAACVPAGSGLVSVAQNHCSIAEGAGYYKRATFTHYMSRLAACPQQSVKTRKVQGTAGEVDKAAKTGRPAVLRQNGVRCHQTGMSSCTVPGHWDCPQWSDTGIPCCNIASVPCRNAQQQRCAAVRCRHINSK